MGKEKVPKVARGGRPSSFSSAVSNRKIIVLSLSLTGGSKMAWFNFLFNTKAAQLESKPTKENHGASYNSGGVKNPFSPMTALQAYANHGYLYAAINRACEDLASLPIKLIKGKGSKAKELMDHPVLELLHNPSTNVDSFLLREQILLDLILSGSCYVLLLGPREKPDSIIRLHPDEVKIVTDKFGIKGYEHNSGGSMVMYPPDRILTARNASYGKGPKSLYGTGAIESLRRELNADINAQNLASQASSQGHPDILISPKDGDIWPKETRKQISDNYNKLAKSGGVMVMSGEADVTPLNLSPKDMEFQAVRNMTMQVISAVIGTPPSVLGLPSANYATSRQQAINYWELQKKRAYRIDIMLTRLAKLWDRDLHVIHDFSSVEPLQAVRSSQLERVQLHIMNGMSASLAYQYEGMQDAPIGKNATQDIEEEIVIDDKSEKTILRLFQSEEERRRNVWKSFIEKRHGPTEAKFLQLYRKYLKEARKRYISRAEEFLYQSEEKNVVGYKTKQSFIEVVDWNSLEASDIEQKKIRELVRKEYSSAYQTIGQEELSKVLKMAEVEDQQFKAGDALKRHLQTVSRQITKTTTKKIRDAVRKGEEEGLSKDNIINNIKASAGFTESRAALIARTESTKTINSAITEAYIQAREVGVVVNKVWITEGDDVVRETHAELDGKSIPPASDFVSSSGAIGSGPASMGAPSEDINCRCTLEAEVIRE
jgi:HK97 family phage portal protein